MDFTDRPNGPHLDSAEVGEDLATLDRALESAWGGNACGFSEARKSIVHHRATPRATTRRKLCARIAAELDRLPDAHLEVMLDDDLCGRPLPEARVGANFGGDALWTAGKRGDAALLSITRFPPPGDPEWTGMLEAVERLKQARILVIDVRGNSGGDDRMAYRVAERLAGHAVVRDGATKIITRTPEALVARLNGVRARRQVDDSAALEQAEVELRRDLAEALAGRLPSPVELPVSQAGVTETKYAPYEGRTFVLVDRACGSSCENAVDLWRRIPRVTSVGEHTAGAIHFGNAGRVRLPHSRIVVQLGTQCTRFGNGQFFEKIGFPPDVAVRAGKDALDVALSETKAR